MRNVLSSIAMAMAVAALTMPALAKAADLGPFKAPTQVDRFVPSPFNPPIYNWTGFYLGVQGGYGWGDSSGTQNAGGALFPVVPYTINPSGFIGGGHVGFNYQTGSTVLGIEGDLEGSGLDGLSNFSASGQNYSFDAAADTLVSVRGRVGFAHDRYLVYGTGGVAWGHVTAPPDAVGNNTLDAWRTGWTAGAGIEYVLFNNWSANIEYRFTDLGRVSNFNPTLNSTDDNAFSFHAIRVGVSRKFGGN